MNAKQSPISKKRIILIIAMCCAFALIAFLGWLIYQQQHYDLFSEMEISSAAYYSHSTKQFDFGADEIDYIEAQLHELVIYGKQSPAEELVGVHDSLHITDINGNEYRIFLEWSSASGTWFEVNGVSYKCTERIVRDLDDFCSQAAARHNAWAEENAAKVYKSFSGTVEIEL